jgi:ribosomal protein S24E
MEQLKILEEKENSLFGRKEVVFEIVLEKAPSKEEIKELVSKKLSKDNKLIKIEGIYGGFGSKSFQIKILSYNSKEDYERVEKKMEEEKIEVKEEVQPEQKAEEVKEEEVNSDA